MKSTRLFVFTAAVLTIACTAKEEKPADSATTPAPAPAPAVLNTADLAGTWTVQVKPMDKDTVIVTYDLTATADTTGWAMTFPGRKAMPIHVIFGGDSVISHAGPYESAVNKGVQVSTETVSRVVAGKMVGMTKATYKVKSGDSVVMLRSEGTKK